MNRWFRWLRLPSVLFLLPVATAPAPALAAEPKPPSLMPEDLARGKPATASDSQGGHEPGAVNDGDGSTRWCAFDGSPGHWWQVDLGRPEDLTGYPDVHHEPDRAARRHPGPPAPPVMQPDEGSNIR